MNIKLVSLTVLAGTGIAIAQTVAPAPPDRLARPAAPDSLARPATPTVSQARDGVRNGPVSSASYVRSVAGGLGRQHGRWPTSSAATRRRWNYVRPIEIACIPDAGEA